MEQTQRKDYAGAYKAEFTLDLRKAALLIIDMQYASGSRLHGLGRQLAEQGKREQGVWRFDRIEDMAVPNIRRLLALFRGAGAPVVYVTIGSDTGDFADIPPYLRPIVAATENRAGAPSHEILDEIRPEPGDLVLNKTTASAFLSTDLHRLLRERDVEQLVLTGISTNSCVESTGRDGADLGYRCVIVDDACSCASEEFQRAAVTNFARLFGRTMSAEQAILELSGGEAPKAVSA